MENEVDATCTTEGSYDSVVYCTVCNAEMTRETIKVDALGHKYDAVVTDPTCTVGGYTTYTCSVCGDSYVADEVAALGHTEGEAVVENEVDATCTAEGSYDSVVYCTVCGEVVSRETIKVDALGHDWQEDGSCSRCEEKQENPKENPFIDIPEDEFYTEPVLWAVGKGITTGTTATTFTPYRIVTRGEALTFLWRAMGSPEPNLTINPFTDVRETDYCYKAVLWAAQNGITAGVGDNRFAPAQECNRAQILTFLWRAMRIILRHFLSETAVTVQVFTT